MDVNLQFVEADLLDHERPIYNVLKATLEYPADPGAKASKLADDIRFISGWRNEANHADCVLWQLWRLVLNIASCIPADHPWQHSLIQALDTLQKRDDSVIEHDEHQTLLWKDLPNLGMVTREAWIDPYGEDPNELMRWKNLNSFVARQGTSIELAGLEAAKIYAPGATLPIWQLRTALEEPAAKGPAMECRLWTATEWIIYYGDVLFLEMHPKVEVDKRMGQVVATSELAQDIVPHSPERLAFWKKRLSNLSSDAQHLRMEDSIIERITEALKVMESVESKRGYFRAERSAEGNTSSAPEVRVSVDAKADPAQVEGSVES